MGEWEYKMQGDCGWDFPVCLMCVGVGVWVWVQVAVWRMALIRLDYLGYLGLSYLCNVVVAGDMCNKHNHALERALCVYISD